MWVEAQRRKSKGRGRRRRLPSSSRPPSSTALVPVGDVADANRQFNDAMSQAAYNATGTPKPNPSSYRSKGGERTRVRETWRSQVESSHANNTGSGMADPNNPVETGIVERAVQEERARQIQEGYVSYGLKKKKLEEANKTWWDKLGDKVSDVMTGSGLNSKTTESRRAYNDFLFSQGRENEYVKSNRAFQQMQEEVGIHGGKFDGNAEGFDTIRRVHKAEQEAAAEAAKVARETAEGGKDLSGIADWMSKNQLIVAGALVGGAVLLDDE